MPTAKTVTTNFFWRFFERCGAQFVAFFVSIILARLLDPTVYGEIALITVFTCILQVFVDSGLGSALIQKKNADDLDFSSVFYFNIAVCLAMYGVMFFAALAGNFLVAFIIKLVLGMLIGCIAWPIIIGFRIYKFVQANNIHKSVK